MALAWPNRFSTWPVLLIPALFMYVIYVYSPTNHPNALPVQRCSETVEDQPKFNLMEETHGSEWAKRSADEYLSPADCTIVIAFVERTEYANTNRLPQDHPCVIRLIRHNYLRLPAPKYTPYQMDHPETIDPSDGPSKEILRVLKNLTNGFFIECGAFDGEFLSNTLYMERSLDWTGLLVEAGQTAYGKLASRNRQAYTCPVCLSTKPYPMEVAFSGTLGTGAAIVEEKELQSDRSTSSTVKGGDDQGAAVKDADQNYKTQCFPLYSILLAIGRTQVDYFSLDVEGAEHQILETIPWHKVTIQTVTAEWNHVPGGEAGLTSLMESNKYTKSGLISNYYTREVVYVRDSFNIYREKEN